MITEQQYIDSAKELGVEVAVVKAVAEVEGEGDGFINGLPKILFEPHVFWKELRKRGIDPTNHTKGNEDILYRSWGEKPYGKSSAQFARLDRAAKIHREAALSSCSWGLFQILGNNFKAAGFNKLQGFINAMYHSEDEHLKAFIKYIKNNYLDDELRAHDWKGFARAYNGKYYYKNKYDIKLASAYKKFKT